MKTLLLAITASLTISIFTACAETPAGSIPPVPSTAWMSSKKTMRAFRSEEELKRYLKELAEKQTALARRSVSAGVASEAVSDGSVSAAKTALADKQESITNVQHAGVDEGGIVKLHGPYLVVLRRGRLFTVRIGDDNLQPVSAVDAFGPDINPKYSWYDEMLVSGNTVVVIGYSYERGGTEIGLFGIDDAGRLSYRSTHHLRSNDYYSSRNYASRLIDNKLIFYTPLRLNLNYKDPLQSFPALRKWHKGATEGEFRMIAPPTRIYRSEKPMDFRFGASLHTVTVCDLAGDFKCEATGVIGPFGRVFYVSPSSVYVWATEWNYDRDQMRTQSLLFRMPLDGSSPSSLGVSGSPVDQFSFLESEDGHLNVLLRSNAAGDGMWRAEVAEGDVALMRVPLWSFSDGSENVPAANYRALPKPEGYTFQNRFVGEYLLYGTGSGWGYPEQKVKPKLYTVRWADGTTRELEFAHGVDRIEQVGSDAVVVGADEKDLHFTAVRLLAGAPEVADRFTRKDAAQGELRSHGFFYRAEGLDSGILGLPISRPGRPGYEHLFEESAAILFLRNQSLRFEEVGELAARPERATNDSCRASCVDWYGNARPLFIRGRIFALLGYEIVEGTVSDGRMRELRRVSYAPGRAQITRQSG